MMKLRVLLPLLAVAGIGLVGCIAPPPPPPPPPPALVGVDLVVLDVAWRLPLAVGEPVQFQITVKNVGDTPTPANTIVDVLVSVDGVDVGWSDNVTIPLAAGSSRYQMVNGGPDGSDGLWTATPGRHQVRAFVNSGSLPARPPIPESSRDNNTVFNSFFVEPPGTIAYISDRNAGNSEVWTMSADGSNQSQLTNSPEAERDPRLSPDGTKIVFVRRNVNTRALPLDVIWVMNVDGTDAHAVSPPADSLSTFPAATLLLGDRDPTWSADGTQIAFVRDGQATPTGILMMNSDGGDAHVVVPTPEAFRITDPAFSPDGTRMAYSYDFIGPAWNFIIIRNLDGSGGFELTKSPFHNPITDLSIRDEAPAWSPDSTRIAFVGNLNPAGPNGIWVINADGSNPIPLTGGTSPSWSPDGQRITFERDGSVWNMNSDGSDPVLAITSGTQPNWGRTP